MELSEFEIAMLRTLLKGAQPLITSSHRIRLEMLGLVRDGADGLILTAAGRQAAVSVSRFKPEPVDKPRIKTDAAGRKKLGQRRHAFE